MTKRRHKGVPHSRWTKAEDAALLETAALEPFERYHHAGQAPLRVLAERLGRSYGAVWTRRSRLLRGRA